MAGSIAHSTCPAKAGICDRALSVAFQVVSAAHESPKVMLGCRLMERRRVHVLPPHVADQIAAGEVVERPESVVKELVENALDAGATRVRVEVENGGQDRIRVLDDGHGMSPEDAMTALLRHATSKVASVSDLEAIGTLGFRGEALPSIRSVSRFSLRTRIREAEEGVRITAHGADAPVLEPCAAPPGTEITVDELFFNVPARRKFLKQAVTELHRIRELLDRLALGWPEVHFTLVSGGRVVQDIPPAGGLQARILQVLGKDVCRRLYAVSLAIGEHRVEGFASDPGFFKSSNAWQYTYINGRFVRDKVLQHAITQAYSDTLQRGQFPVGVLYVFIPPESVDINVHPAKSEVRFVESQVVHGLVLRGVRLMLADAPWSGLAPVVPGENTRLAFMEDLPSGAWTHAEPGKAAEPPAPAEGAAKGPAGIDSLSPGSDAWRSAAGGASSGGPGSAPASSSAPLRRLGMVADRFVVLDGGDSLVLVDAPSALAAVLERQLLARTGARSPSQALLFPEPVALSAKELALACPGTPESAALAALGFAVEPFGGSDVLVSSVPADLPDVAPAALLRAALGARGRPSGTAAGDPHLLETMARAVSRAAVPPGALPEPLLERMVRGLDSLDPTVLAGLRVRLDSLALSRLFPPR